MAAAADERAASGAEGNAMAAVDDATMRDIVDKLSLLHYETDFCRQVKPPFPPLTHAYFATPSTVDHANMQFYYFTSLCTWLMGLCGHRVDAPGQFDDPNVSATNLLTALRGMGVAVTGVAPNRLKQGSGEAVLAVLATLIDHTLTQRHVALAAVDYSHVGKYDELATVGVDDDDDHVADDDDAAAVAAGGDVEDRAFVDSDGDSDKDDDHVSGGGDGGLYAAATAFGERVADVGSAMRDADDEASGIGGGGGATRRAASSLSAQAATAAPPPTTTTTSALPHLAATSSVSAEEWQLEVERVAPLLQVRAPDEDSWRVRVEHAAVLMRAVEQMYPGVRHTLTRMGDDLDKSREHLQKREQTLAQQFSEQVEQYRVKLRELATSRDAAAVANASVQQLTSELGHLSEQLEQVKRDTEDHEAKISDTAPLMQVKAAVAKVQGEIRQMSLRIGVLQHSVLNYVMKQTKAKREQPLTSGGSLLDEDGYELYYD